MGLFNAEIGERLFVEVIQANSGRNTSRGRSSGGAGPVDVVRRLGQSRRERRIGRDSPDADQEANWLPAPAGPFSVIMRLYWPKADALDGRWVAPSLQKAD